ncbi:MAG: hypothetical protein JW864_02025 [Spirochaetes bacterium]|nr:hypothetical protein [Spirochaetota bacterium]
MKNYTEFTNEEKTTYWQKHFENWQDSGLSQKNYCESNAASYWNFKTWYAKLRPVSGNGQNKFIKVKSWKNDTVYAGKIEIIFPDNIRIIVEDSISESSLRKIFSAKGSGND